MKKILLSILIFLTFFSGVFAYNPTIKDKTILNNVYKKLDIIIDKQPLKAKKLLNQINGLKGKIKNERTEYLILELLNYLETKLNYDENYEVIEVIDGDTIKIDISGEEKTIRMIGIDTPESYETRFGYKECYGDEASDYLKNLIEGKQIKIEFDITQGKEDKYGRLLAYVFLNGENINNLLIEEGYAWEYTYDKAYKYQEKFKNSQEKAKNNNKGLWQENTCNGERKEIKEDDVNNINNTSEGSSFKYYNPNNLNYLNMGFSCEKPKYCKYMTSCEEATYYYKVCGAKGFDRDDDLIPCEDICGTEMMK